MKVEWDENKNMANIIKHKISFEEAATVFEDDNALTIFDDLHSSDEDRFFLIGRDDHFRELNVCHCYRGKDGEIARIISARRATKKEYDLYWREIKL